MSKSYMIRIYGSYLIKYIWKAVLSRSEILRCSTGFKNGYFGTYLQQKGCYVTSSHTVDRNSGT